MIERGRHTKQEQKLQVRKERIQKQLYLLHSASGHCSGKYLVEALKRRGADPLTLNLARSFQCAICSERRKVEPRHLASLEPVPPKFKTVVADIGHWCHPHTHEDVQFMIVVDEGSRFRVAKVLSKGRKQSPNATSCLQYLQEGWVA